MMEEAEGLFITVSKVCTNSAVELSNDFLKQKFLPHYDTEIQGLIFQPKK